MVFLRLFAPHPENLTDYVIIFRCLQNSIHQSSSAQRNQQLLPCLGRRGFTSGNDKNFSRFHFVFNSYIQTCLYTVNIVQTVTPLLIHYLSNLRDNDQLTHSLYAGYQSIILRHTRTCPTSLSIRFFCLNLLIDKLHMNQKDV